jgi:hypothetical protein
LVTSTKAFHCTHLIFVARKDIQLSQTSNLGRKHSNLVAIQIQLNQMSEILYGWWNNGDVVLRQIQPAPQTNRPFQFKVFVRFIFIPTSLCSPEWLAETPY